MLLYPDSNAQDTADGEFSVIKTAIARYLKRSDKDSPYYIEVKDSNSVIEFCKKHLSNPGSKTGIQGRLFTSISPSVFLERKKESPDTFAGISKKYQYMCGVIHNFLYSWINKCLLRLTEQSCGGGIPVSAQPASNLSGETVLWLRLLG